MSGKIEIVDWQPSTLAAVTVFTLRLPPSVASATFSVTDEERLKHGSLRRALESKLAQYYLPSALPPIWPAHFPDDAPPARDEPAQAFPRRIGRIDRLPRF